MVVFTAEIHPNWPIQHGVSQQNQPQTPLDHIFWTQQLSHNSSSSNQPAQIEFPSMFHDVSMFFGAILHEKLVIQFDDPPSKTPHSPYFWVVRSENVWAAGPGGSRVQLP